jgi:hypothetical protein
VQSRTLTWRLRIAKAVEACKRKIEVRGNVARRASPIEQLNRLADKLRRACDCISAAELSRHSTLPLSRSEYQMNRGCKVGSKTERC